jgi:hypothetical protein
MNHEEAARELRMVPASLSPASPAPRFAETVADAAGAALLRLRPALPHQRRIHDPDHGSRWFDRCRQCLLETPPTLPVPPGRFLADLRDAAADARLRLCTYTDEGGWKGE